jgi:hypothetical protein
MLIARLRRLVARGIAVTISALVSIASLALDHRPLVGGLDGSAATLWPDVEGPAEPRWRVPSA